MHTAHTPSTPQNLPEASPIPNSTSDTGGNITPNTPKSTLATRLAIFAIASTTVLGPTIIAPSLPELEAHFASTPHADMLSKLILTLPALSIMIFSPLAGFAYAAYKRLPIIFAALVLWSVAGASGFMLDNLYALLVSRFFLGVATAFLATGVGVLIGDYYKGRAREKVLSTQNFAMAIGGAIFLVGGGVLAEISWRFPFLAYLGGIFILLYVKFALFEPQAIPQAPKVSHDSFVQRLRAMWAWLYKFAPVYFLGFFAMMMFNVVPTQIPFFISHILEKPNSQIGISMASTSLAMAFFSLMYNRVRAFLSIKHIASVALMLIGTGLFIIGFFHNYTSLLFALMCIGAGLGLILINNSSWLYMLASDSERPKAYGFLASFLFMGQFCSPFLTQPIVKAFGLIEMFVIMGFVLYGLAVAFLFARTKAA